MECKIIDMFNFVAADKEETGVILESQSSGVKTFYVSYKKDLDNYRVGTDTRFLDVPIAVVLGRQPNQVRRVNIPTHMVEVGVASLSGLEPGLRRTYLLHLYTRLLWRPFAGETKEFNPEVIFADRTLMLIAAAYHHFGKDSLQAVLEQNDFQYERQGVYTRMPEDLPGVVYNTPRTLNYYPNIRTVRVSWTVGGTPMDIVRYDDPLKKSDEYIKSQPFQLKIQKVYQNEGWVSLREAMEKDPQLHDFIRQFYLNGYGKRGQRPFAAA
ncbi:hypothetical protein [Ralstonia phage RSF1]|uniref:Uncharacterized protein n=1 Tax=Ralstonia phage RSF1 TaxID=1689679 RepID=A0A0K2QQY2_9CAUD|nr:hypothetical protein AVU11_gp213 [Ralstonia phage RSF1]BAS05005.1 hypothetical protein [Ralstonia phage RSF1]